MAKKLSILTLGVPVLFGLLWTVGFSENPPVADAEKSDVTADDDTSSATSTEADEAAESKSSGEPIPSPEALDVLQEARQRLVEYRSIKTDVVQTVALGDRRFRAQGHYLQGINLKLRLEFQIKLGEAVEGTLLEVCDGQVLWTRHTIDGEARITRRDVRQILEAATRSGRIAQNILVAELGLGGLPALLASLERSMVFHRHREEEIDGKQFIVIEGTWGTEFREQFQNRKKNSARRLPEYVPDEARIYFDHQTLFPRRLVYLKQHPAPKALRPMVTLNFINVVLNGPVNEQEFDFIPPDGIYQEDITNRYLEQLNQPPLPSSGR